LVFYSSVITMMHGPINIRSRNNPLPLKMGPASYFRYISVSTHKTVWQNTSRISRP